MSTSLGNLEPTFRERNVVIVILDNRPAHKSAVTQKILEDIGAGSSSFRNTAPISTP